MGLALTESDDSSAAVYIERNTVYSEGTICADVGLLMVQSVNTGWLEESKYESTPSASTGRDVMDKLRRIAWPPSGERDHRRIIPTARRLEYLMVVEAYTLPKTVRDAITCSNSPMLTPCSSI